MKIQRQWEEHFPERIFIMKVNDNTKKLICIVLLLAVWQAAAVIVDKSILLASPVQVLVRLFSLIGDPGFFRSIWFSFSRIAAGFFSGLAVGALCAVLSGSSGWIRAALDPVFNVAKSVPVASFIIIALVWLSSGKLSSFISFLMVVPVVYTNLLGGIEALDPEMKEVAKVFSISPARRLIYIDLPQLRPYITSACRLSLGLAWKSGIAAEVIGLPSGSIGRMLYDAKVYFDTADLFAWTLVIVLISVLCEKLFLLAVDLLYRRLEKL